MPCPGLVNCQRKCGHKRIVHDYYAAREADELRRDEFTYGYETENREYHGRLITFRTYLEGIANE